jgi:hypothetical protein
MVHHVATLFSGTNLPPSLAGDSHMYVLSVFGQYGVAVIAMEWIWRNLHALIDDRRPINHPLTINRIVWLLVMVGILMRVGPHAVQTMVWPEVTPITRFRISAFARICGAISFIPMIVAWLLSLFSRFVVDYQLAREPVPKRPARGEPITVDLWPSWRRIRQPVLILVMVLGIAIALAPR